MTTEPEDDGDDAGRDIAPDRFFSGGRASASAWVAAGAVALAFFLLGGFIRTHRQLEGARREAAELREALRRAQAAPAAAQAPRAPRRSLAAAARDGRARIAANRASGEDGRASLRPATAGNATATTIAELPSIDEPKSGGIKYQWGRRSNGETSRLLISPSGGPCQVVSVSSINKRVMIEGGRDVELTEGMRLELLRDGRWIADLRVLDVFDNQSSCEILHATRPPEPGDTIRKPEQGV